MRKWPFYFCLCAALVVAGCAKPIPPGKHAYVGKWQSSNMIILITQGGRVAYKRRFDGNVYKSIRAPIEKFEGNNFVVGVGSLSTTFVVSVPPHEVHGHWKMTVDGVELARQEAPDRRVDKR